jgi:hypothetical protein
MKKRLSQTESVERLTVLFQRNGYVRVPNQARREEMRTTYKMGWEVRLPLKSRAELAEVRIHLKNIGLRPGKPFRKSLQWVQPIYGKAAFETFRRWRQAESSGHLISR